ncbi:hypothetical protein JGU66_31010 [Myxococcaceae bacterium JPH2]|nr:hypothetical protein [Myxococcaceae bacterium JPH2]
MSFLPRFGAKRALLLAAAAVVTTGVSASALSSYIPSWPPPPMPPGSTECTEFCYNVDITNNTPNAANDLHVTLTGPTKICTHYLGSLNPFGTPREVHSGNVTDLHFQSNTAWVQPGEIAHIGFCTNSPVAGMTKGHNAGNLPPFYWTKQRIFIGDVIAVGHQWANFRDDLVAVDPGVVLSNTTGTVIHVRQVDFALVDKPIALDKLMWSTLDKELEWQPVAQGGTLPPGSEDAPGFFQAPFPVELKADDPRTVIFRFWAEDPKDPSNMNRGLGQASVASLVKMSRQDKK